MWIMTTDGFISVVNKAEDGKDWLCVRSREKSTLEAVCRKVGVPIGTVTELEGSDYEFRVWLSRNEVNMYLIDTVDGLEYHNFKSEVEYVQGKDSKYLEFLSGVWMKGFAILGTFFDYRDEEKELFDLTD